YYTEYLLQTEQYKLWVDLHLKHQVGPSQISEEAISKIESVDLSLMLPLYHHSIERYISGKSRDQYMMAVKLLRKLKRYYSELNKLERWDKFINLLQKRYARLPSLQKELRRGNIII